VCKGRGIVEMPHIPSNKGGWMDTNYNFSGIQCAACNGSGIETEFEDTSYQRSLYDQKESSKINKASLNETQASETADVQLERVLSKLKVCFKYSPCFPAPLMQVWIDTLYRFDMWKPDEGLSLLNEYEAAFEETKQRYRPSRDIFSMSVHKEMTFDHHVTEISRNFQYLRQLMLYLQDFLKKHPNGI
jgi:DNA-binding XRE family transcriptional regulator